MSVSLHSKGFSLIELMITVAIIGILMAIAVPSYQEHVKKTRREDAQAALMQFRQVMEKYYTNRFTYRGAAVNNGDTGEPAFFPASTPLNTAGNNQAVKYYDLTIVAATDTGFTLQAAVVQNGPQAGDSCGNLTLQSNGIRSSSGDSANCWED